MNKCLIVFTYSPITGRTIRLSADRLSAKSKESIGTWSSEIVLPEDIAEYFCPGKDVRTLCKELAKRAMAPRWVYRDER